LETLPGHGASLNPNVLPLLSPSVVCGVFIIYQVTRMMLFKSFLQRQLGAFGLAQKKNERA